jgi:8-oxo-dGTP diphosphatase
MKTAEGRLLKDDSSNYDKDAFERPSVTVDICISGIIDNKLKILLIKRKYPPFKDCWALPGGFLQVENNETLEQTAERELKEETGFVASHLEQLKTYGDPKRDPRMRIITVAHFALIKDASKYKPKAGDDAKEAEWFDITELPKLGFDHETIIKDFKERIKGKVMYTPIAFSLVPEEYTWYDLKKVYELILGEKLDASNFRREIKSSYVIEEIKSKTSGKIGRKAAFIKMKKVKNKF